MADPKAPSSEPVLIQIPNTLKAHPTLGRFAGQLVEVIGNTENPDDTEHGGTVVLSLTRGHLQ